MFYGRRLLLPATAFTDSITSINAEDQTEEKLLSHLVHLRKVIEKARAVNLQQLRISKIYFDRFSSCINSYAVGQRVFLKQPNRQKLQLHYPKEFEVIRKIYDNVYEVRSLEDPADVRRYNAARLKPFSAAFLPLSITSATQISSMKDDQGNSGATKPKTVVSSHGPHDSKYMESNTVQSGNLAHEAQRCVQGEASNKYDATSRQHDVHPADGHSSHITRSVSRTRHERLEDSSGTSSASLESQRGEKYYCNGAGRAPIGSTGYTAKERKNDETFFNSTSGSSQFRAKWEGPGRVRNDSSPFGSGRRESHRCRK